MATEIEELEILKQNSPYALPDNAAQSGWSTAQIKEKFYAGLLYLYSLLKNFRTSASGDIETLKDDLEDLETAVNNIVNGDTVVPKAIKDQDGNVIKDTYVKITNIVNGTIACLKYVKDSNTTENINAIEPRLKALITTLQGYFTSGKANNALLADRATSDASGKNIENTYATKAENNANTNKITKIENGQTVVDKALKDSVGNTINTTYATKSEDAQNLQESKNYTDTKTTLQAIQTLLGDATTGAKGLMTAEDKVRLNALYESFANGDADNVVNRLKDVLDIFNNYPEGTTIITALASKINTADIANNLTTNDATKVLSAAQGVSLESKKVNYNDILTIGAAVIGIMINGQEKKIAQSLSISVLPKVVATTSALPATNDGNLYLVLADGYLYVWQTNAWARGLQYTTSIISQEDVVLEEDY